MTNTAPKKEPSELAKLALLGEIVTTLVLAPAVLYLLAKWLGANEGWQLAAAVGLGFFMAFYRIYLLSRRQL